jgi:hypothetical protein
MLEHDVGSTFLQRSINVLKTLKINVVVTLFCELARRNVVTTSGLTLEQLTKVFDLFTNNIG